MSVPDFYSAGGVLIYGENCDASKQLPPMTTAPGKTMAPTKQMPTAYTKGQRFASAPIPSNSPKMTPIPTMAAMKQLATPTPSGVPKATNPKESKLATVPKPTKREGFRVTNSSSCGISGCSGSGPALVSGAVGASGAAKVSGPIVL